MSKRPLSSNVATFLIFTQTPKFSPHLSLWLASVRVDRSESAQVAALRVRLLPKRFDEIDAAAARRGRSHVESNEAKGKIHRLSLLRKLRRPTRLHETHFKAHKVPKRNLNQCFDFPENISFITLKVGSASTFSDIRN